MWCAARFRRLMTAHSTPGVPARRLRSWWGRGVAEATKPDDFYKASTRETGAILSGTKALAKYKCEHLSAPTVREAYAIAISCPDTRGLQKESWQSVIVAPNAVYEGFRSPGTWRRPEGQETDFWWGVKRPCFKFKLPAVQTSIISIRHFLLTPRNARSH